MYSKRLLGCALALEFSTNLSLDRMSSKHSYSFGMSRWLYTSWYWGCMYKKICMYSREKSATKKVQNWNNGTSNIWYLPCSKCFPFSLIFLCFMCCLLLNVFVLYELYNFIITRTPVLVSISTCGSLKGIDLIFILDFLVDAMRDISQNFFVLSSLSDRCCNLHNEFITL